MKAKHLLVEFYDPAEDDLVKANYDDSRRPRLTMLHLHKMRLAKDAERMDAAERLDFLPSMYGVPVSEGEMKI